MNTAIVWLLVAITNGSATSPQTLAKFPTEAACLDTSKRLEAQLSGQTFNTRNLHAACVRAEVVLP